MPADCFFIYVLRSAKTGRRYVGSTQDVEERLHRHNAGHSKSTKAGAPWVLIHTEMFPTRAAAVEREMFLKTGVGRACLDAQFGSAVA